MAEYLATLDDATFGAATPVKPKFASPVDPAARWTAAWGGPAVYAYCTNYLIDVEHAIIVDVEPSTAVRHENGMMRYRASKLDCDACALKPSCCPKEPARKVLRSIHEGARDMARDIAKTDAYQTSRYQRKKVEMLFAHLKRILKLDRLRLRGPYGARDEFHLAAIAQNLRKLAKICTLGTYVRAT